MMGFAMQEDETRGLGLALLAVEKAVSAAAPALLRGAR